MPGPETMTLKKVSIEALASGTKLCHNGRWYEWQRVQADDLRHLAYFLSPNAPTGERTNTGHTIADGTEVEVLCKESFDERRARLIRKLSSPTHQRDAMSDPLSISEE